MNLGRLSNVEASDVVLEIGAGCVPDDRSTMTLDIRTDLEHIDHPGVDVGVDEWPIESESVDMVIANHVVEHIPPARIGHLFEEVDRVLTEGGIFHVVTPHVGSWAAATDPTHYGTGGWTPSVTDYFTGELEQYWPDLQWNAYAWATLTFPTFFRERRRVELRVSDGGLSFELLKSPFVTGVTEFIAEMNYR